MIRDRESLRERYPEPGARAVAKELRALDEHCRRFIELSPFVVLATAGADGGMDASPRGGPPGFVRVVDDTTLHLPDAPGNNRLDSLTNIAETGRVGMLFLIPGVDETLRVNGTAVLRGDDEVLDAFARADRRPRAVVEVAVETAFLHCAKALMRSKLWSPESLVERSALPTMGQMINDQIGSTEPPEPQDAMVARYQRDL